MTPSSRFHGHPERHPDSTPAEPASHAHAKDSTADHGGPAGIPSFLDRSHGLGDARMHTDTRAAQAAEALGAQAFTLGRDVYFASGRFAPDTPAGRKLLAHELTHVAQQKDSAARGSAAADPGGVWEREAETAASNAVEGRSPRHTVPTTVTRSPARLACAPDAKASQPSSREDLERRYGITIQRGDADWTADEIQDLAWSLGRLTGRELTAVRGYGFKRWKTPTSRAAADPSYDPGTAHGQECGLHEADLTAGKLQISMYDGCFDPAASMAGVPLGRFNLLHEMGHAMEAASQRAEHRRVVAAQAAYADAHSKAGSAIAAYNTANDERNALVAEYNAADPATQKRLKSGVEKARARAKALDEKAKALKAADEVLEKRLTAAESKREAAETAPGEAFAKLVKGKDPLTEYSKTGNAEAFAEAFAIYRADPESLKKRRPELFDWFSRQGELGGVEGPEGAKRR
ncbi:MAG: DUF4157 domain-containing protein [Gemmatimonadales bacterium]